MSGPIKLAAIFSGVKSRRDRSYRLEFDTRELGGDAASLLEMHGSECWLIVAPSEDAIEAVEIPSERPDSLTPKKSKAARQRSVMFIYWKQQGGDNVFGSFDSWYSSVMERNIDQWKPSSMGRTSHERRIQVHRYGRIYGIQDWPSLRLAH